VDVVAWGTSRYATIDGVICAVDLHSISYAKLAFYITAITPIVPKSNPYLSADLWARKDFLH
jgi:hypothetical protein